MLRHCAIVELPATMPVKVVRHDGVNLIQRGSDTIENAKPKTFTVDQHS